MVTGSTLFSCSTPRVITNGMYALFLRTTVLCQKYRVRCTGTETRFSRLSDVDVRALGGALPLLSYQVLTACDQSAMAWIAVVLPQLFGPMSTAG